MKHSSPSLFHQTAAAVLLGAGLLVSNATAATIVDWGGDYVSADTALQTGTVHTSGDGKTVTYRYSESAPKSPASGYTAPVGKSGVFYGAFENRHRGGSDARFDLYSITKSATGDTIQIQGRSGEVPLEGASNHLSGLIFFQKEDFLVGAQSDAKVTLDSESSLKLRITNVPTADRRFRAAVYALVDGEWNWYLSSATHTGGATTTTLNLNAETAKWALWDINESLTEFNPAPSSSSYTLLGTSFEDISAVGFYFSIDIVRPDSTTAPGIRVGDITFNANVAAIPEPATSALLLLTGVGLLYGFRRRTATKRATAMSRQISLLLRN